MSLNATTLRDGGQIVVVATTAGRDHLFPTPVQDLCVYNLQTLKLERYNVSAWESLGVLLSGNDMTFPSDIIVPDSIYLDNAAGTNRFIRVRSSGVLRWRFGGSATAESGANAGTNIIWAAYDDAGVDLGTYMTLTRSNGLLAVVNNISGKRFIGSGTAHVAGDYALSAGWGNTATVSTVAARDTGGRVSITCGGSGIAANPTVTLTYKDGTWTTVPTCVPQRSDINAPETAEFRPTSDTATTFVLTFLGTPVSGTIYTFSFHVIGK